MKLAIFSILLILISGFVFGFDENDYDNDVSLTFDPDEYRLFWRIEGDEIYMAFKVRTLGWIGFGISEPTSGSMPGADILHAYVDDSTGIVHISDRHTTGYYPVLDDCQDWGLVSGEEMGEYTIIEVVRKLETDDKQDRVIHEGSVRVIYAYHPEDGLNQHTVRRATAVTFYGTPPPTSLAYMLDQPNTFAFDFLNGNQEVPPVKTHYGDTSFPIPGALPSVHIIGIEHILDNRTAPLIHHFVLSGTYDGNPLSDFIWEWAPGIEPLVLPDAAGYRVGPGGITTLHMQTHFDNPDTLEVEDNSGLRIYYTTDLRQYDAGVLQLGDPAVLENDPIQSGSGEKEYEYSCPSECTSELPWDLHVFSSFLHMHAVGSRVWTTQWRNDQLIRTTNRIEFWDFAFQQQTSVDFIIQPGDRLNTHCVYKRGAADVPFGSASYDEMCMDYLSYYPKLPVPSLCGLFPAGNFRLTYCFGNVTTLQNPFVLDGPEPPISFGVNEGYTCPNEYVTEDTNPPLTSSTSNSQSATISDTSNSQSTTISDGTDETGSGDTVTDLLEDSSVNFIVSVLALFFSLI